MKNLKYILIVALGLGITAHFLHAGAQSSGGGDNWKPESLSAWFLDKQRTISYCVQVSDKFGVDLPTVQNAVEGVFTQWRNYIDDRKPDYNLATRVKYSAVCDAQTDLIFYLGVENGDVKKAKKAYDNPMAFAQRLSYDITKGWGQGFIWMANIGSLQKIMDPPEYYPNWKDNDRLYGALLHEVGHVLGCQHLADTIMDENIADYLRDSFVQHLNNGRLRKIDWNRELVDCVASATRRCIYTGQIGKPPLNGPPVDYAQRVKEVFNAIVGRDPLGDVHVSLESKPVNGVVGLVYSISDDSGHYSFEVPARQGGWTADQAYLLTQVWQKGTANNSSQSQVVGSIAHSYTFYGFIMANGVQKIPIIAEQNMLWQSYSVLAVLNGDFINIFTSQGL